MIDALIEAERRGLTVRFVTDDEHNPKVVTDRLRGNGISVVEDKRTALMHNKFIVIDERVVWMGSLNFTTNGVFCNNNVVVRWDSAELSENYLIELAEMYDDRAFGPTSLDNTTDRLVVGGMNVENYFAPETEVAPIIAREIARADEEILFLAFSFTNSDIGEAIIERADAGLQVYGVFESIGSDAGSSYYNDFRRENLPNLQVLKDGNPRIMHEKVIVLDGDTVIFGSFNFSDSANDSNDENIMIVRNETFAAYFVDEFIRVWQEAGGE
jgi:phosphatidylserine/phosphatidylglycerophosphate/cardiolipin synthase-like enzyme